MQKVWGLKEVLELKQKILVDNFTESSLETEKNLFRFTNRTLSNFQSRLKQ